ncbi:heme A synthase [Cryptosporangium sp. NPDC048952]|uniref:COX15/CtaA family protein n=1 Tax=Cryptosporangium sp. NPDC048952 TaxID=3363961 RepID=UPI003724AE64
MSTATAGLTTTAPPREPGRFSRLRDAPKLVRWLAFATIVGNAVVVLTGVAVRLSGSGLGCPTWPKCTDDSYTNTPEYGIHGYIEFGNRLLTFVLSAIVGAAIIVVWLQYKRRRSLVWLSLAQFGGIVAQAVVGGITVLTGLNPWTVSAHFLVSMALIYAGYVFWHRTGEGDRPRDWRVPVPLRWLARAIVLAAGATIVIGTVVTGSGPHSGDGAAPRTGFDPALVSQLHADAVFLLIGLTVGGVFAFRSVPVVRNAVLTLLVVELAQGLIGYVQYFTHLPVLLVALHVLGAAVLWVFAIRVLFTVRERPTLAT